MDAIVLVILLITITMVIAQWCSHPTMKDCYEKMGGDTPTTVTENFIDVAEHKNLEPLDNYRLGSIYDYYYGDVAAANIYYNEALDQIIERPHVQHTEFIVDRIRDRFDTPKLQNITHKKIQQNLQTMQNKKPSDPQEIKQTLDTKIQWTRDNQNVHDSNVSDDIKKSYDKIVEYNKGKPLIPFRDVSDYMMANYPRTTEILGHIPIDSTISKLNPNSPVKEFDVISQIWTRIHSDENKSNRKELIESLASAITDCKENEIIVCANGRVGRMIQSLAHLDADSKIGELKSKETIRNELFASVGNFVGQEYEKMSSEDKDAYLNDKSTEGTKKYKDAIEKFVQDSVKIYKLPQDESALLITECLAAV